MRSLPAYALKGGDVIIVNGQPAEVIEAQPLTAGRVLIGLDTPTGVRNITRADEHTFVLAGE